MKRPLIHILSGAVLALVFSFLAIPVSAQETINYPEDFPPRALQTVDVFSNSLAPTGSDTGKSMSLSGNRVMLNSGTIAGFVFGAVNLNDSGAVTGNYVTINGGTVNQNVVGGRGITATGNSITISGGTLNNIFGGTGQSVTAGKASATNNSVTISGGVVKGFVFGGYAFSESSNHFATNNTVTIRGAPTFERSAGLLGGSTYHGGTSAGNTLNLHSAGLTVSRLADFQNLNFYLPATLTANGTMLTVTETADITGVTKINVGLEGAGPVLRAGGAFVLIKADELRGDFQPVSGTLGGYTYTVRKEENSLVLVISVPGPTHQYTGQWIKVDDNDKNDEDAWGLTILQNFPGNHRYLFVPWYTYNSAGKAVWYLFQGDKWSADDMISVDVYRYKGPTWGTLPYDNNKIANTKVGTAKLTFTSATTARFEYNVEGSSRSIDLQKLE